jgi:predicted secreted protein
VGRALAVAAVAAALVGAGCGGDGVETFEDPHGKIEVGQGDRFAIELSVNASVGYDWRAVPDPTGVRIVELRKTSVDYPDEERAGDSGVKRFEYRANARGIQTVEFQRFFRGKPDEKRSVNVDVGG